MKNAHLLKKQKRTDNNQFNEFFFEDEVEEIQLFGINVFSNEKKRRYLIELHCSNGFAILKFYPKHLKNNKLKYQLRGKDQLGYALGFEQIKQLLFACATIMRNYLEQNPDHFVGYIGQTDEKDNRPEKRRITAQRSDIYNLLTNSIFLYPKYKLSSKQIFEEVNLRLIRKVRSKQQGKITKAQMNNYNSFLNYFGKHQDKHLELMTDETRKKYM